MYTLQVKFKSQWKWGIVQYDTIEAATARVAELSKVGITARVRKTEEIYK